MSNELTQHLDRLATALRGEQSRLIAEWEQRCIADDTLAQVVKKLTFLEFRDHIPDALDGLCRQIAPDDSGTTDVRRAVASHGHHRWKQGFDLRELIRDWGHLNRVIVAAVHRYFAADAPDAVDAHGEALDRVASFVTESMAGSVRRFDELRKAEAASLARDLQTAKRRFSKLTEARGQLLREATHDVRGGLAAIAGAAELLRDRDGNSGVSGVLERSVGSVRSMLDSLLDLSRLEAGAEPVELTRVDVVALVEELADEFSARAEKKGLELRVSVPPTLEVDTDPTKVRRIAQNLLVNALQYTDDGMISLEAALSTPERWRLVVRDTGSGLQESEGSEVAQQLDHPDDHGVGDRRDPSSAYAGEGIGLTIVRRLCAMLDASINLESERGRGTEIAVAFPMAYPKADD